jgi:hypothetical protein
MHFFPVILVICSQVLPLSGLLTDHWAGGKEVLSKFWVKGGTVPPTTIIYAVLVTE